jgi:hypothetical protein
MDAKDIEAWDRRLLEDAIGESRPPFHRFPNIVLPTGPKTLQLIRSVVGCNIAWKSAAPHFDKGGGPFVATDEHFDPYFTGWQYKPNQDWLDEHGGYARLGHFSVYIDAATPEEFHRWLAKELEAGEWFDIESYWPLLASRLGELRWVYIPFSDEYPLGIFVSRAEDSSWVEHLRYVLKVEAVPFSRIVEERGHDSWHLNDALRSLVTRTRV